MKKVGNRSCLQENVANSSKCLMKLITFHSNHLSHLKIYGVGGFLAILNVVIYNFVFLKLFKYCVGQLLMRIFNFVWKYSKYKMNTNSHFHQHNNMNSNVKKQRMNLLPNIQTFFWEISILHSYMACCRIVFSPI